MAFKIHRGTNISHWLSQSERRGLPRKEFFTEADVRRLADWGFDHIRLPVDEAQLWTTDGKREPEAFDLLSRGLDWCDSAGLKAIVDLHILRSHYFNQVDEPALFTDPAAAQKFADLWRELAAFLKPRSKEMVAFELMNEPVATNDADWNRVAHGAYHAIREIESDRVIVMGSNRWNTANHFDALDVPDDQNMILTFHYYNPMLVTHYNAPWWREGGDYKGEIQYPGQPIPSAAMALLDADTNARLSKFNKSHDRQGMRADLAQPLAKRAKTGLPLYCGEFGVLNRAPHYVRVAWYRDIIGVFDELGIAWGNWDYKGSFGLIDAEGVDTGIAAALLGK